VGGDCLHYREALAVFDVVRQWQRGPRAVTAPSAQDLDGPARKLPDAAAGWLLPLAGEPFEADGSRPIPALRIELRSLCSRAGLTPAESIALTAYAGLHVYPSSRESPIDPISRRLPRIRNRDPRPLNASSVHRIRRSAVEKVARLMPARRSCRVPEIRAATDPLASPWMFAVLSQLHLTRKEFIASSDFRLAVEKARDLMSIGDATEDGAGGPGEAKAGEEAARLTLLGEIDLLVTRYRRANARAGSVNARELARALASLSIALFEIYYPANVAGRTIAHHAQVQRAWEKRDDRPAYLGHTVPSLVIAPGSAAPFTCGKATDDDVIRLMANFPDDVFTTHLLLQLALSSLNPPSQISPEVAVRLLSAAVGNARDREDRRIVHYARRLFEFDGTTNWQAAAAQLNALIACGIVLSAHLEFGGAFTVLKRADELTALAAWAPGRDRIVEMSEWRYQIELMRSGFHRRQAEMQLGSVHDFGATVGAELAEHSLAAAAACTARAGEMLAALPGYHLDRYLSDYGDADAHYYTRLMYRSVEISTLRLIAHEARAAPISVLRSHLSRALDEMQAAISVARADSRRSTPQIPLVKAHLALAISRGDGDTVAADMRQLLRLGWPPFRSVLPVYLLLAGRSHQLPGRIRAAAEPALDVISNSSHSAAQVPDEVRRHQIRRA
jgi:hypothetical protein